jgi:hypothetical protein
MVICIRFSGSYKRQCILLGSYITNDGQSTSLSWKKHPSDAYYQILIIVGQLRVCMGRSLSRQEGSVVFNCCWTSPAQSFSGPSPVGLATVFYCLRFESSLSVASYDLPGYGGGIRPEYY